MTTALEQHEHDLDQLVQIARAGEEVVLTKDGRAVAKITAFSPAIPAPITELGIEDALTPGIPPMEAASATGTASTAGGNPAVRATSAAPGPRKASPEALRAWMQKAAAAAAAGATGKRGLTSDEIIDELREESATPRRKSPEDVVAELRSARRVLTEEEMQRRREWLEMVSRHAEAASTGKVGGPTTEQIIEELREERC